MKKCITNRHHWCLIQLWPLPFQYELLVSDTSKSHMFWKRKSWTNYSNCQNYLSHLWKLMSCHSFTEDVQYLNTWLIRAIVQISERGWNQDNMHCNLNITNMYKILKNGSCFQAFAMFGMLYAFFWVIPWHLNFICQCSGTLCSVFIGGR